MFEACGVTPTFWQKKKDKYLLELTKLDCHPVNSPIHLGWPQPLLLNSLRVCLFSIDPLSSIRRPFSVPAVYHTVYYYWSSLYRSRAIFSMSFLTVPSQRGLIHLAQQSLTDLSSVHNQTARSHLPLSSFQPYPQQTMPSTSFVPSIPPDPMAHLPKLGETRCCECSLSHPMSLLSSAPPPRPDRPPLWPLRDRPLILFRF